MSRTIRIALIGLGNVGRSFLDLMVSKAPVLASRYGLELVLTGAADSSGAVMVAGGIDPAALSAHKARGGNAANFVQGVPGMRAAKLAAQVEADLLLEASVVNLQTGQPGLDCSRAAIRRGMSVVLANKGPLVHAFGELTEAAQVAGVGFAYSATVCGALPVVNIGRRDLAACEVRSVRGIFNATSNSILTAMAAGQSYGDALRQAQLEGVAEADPSLDVEGWDTANKLVIITNSILRQPATLIDVAPVAGITDITAERMREGATRGQVVKLVATAERVDGKYQLSVKPEWLPADSFLAAVNGFEMGIVFDTDIMGLQQYKVLERGPVPTAAAMLRDLINLTVDDRR
ncbi:MAG: homoserine dehydrogenase [Anaerolineae bacterium]|nr:homoserine dehydrogenase [Anaerolineae bacterium]